MKEYIIGKNEANQRADKLIQKILSDASVGFIYKMLRKKNITLNDSKLTGKELLSEGDSLKFWLSDETFVKFKGTDKANAAGTLKMSKLPVLPVVYEDDDIIVFNKPSGLLSQKASPSDISVNDCLLNYLITNNKISKEQLETFTPSICNRLDRNTSGLIICGKSLAGLQTVAGELKAHECKKDYLAIVSGKVSCGDSIKGYLFKDEINNKVTISEKGDIGSYIETEYKPIWCDARSTGLIVRIITGKTHQIRAHLSSIGHPINSDIKYGSTVKRGRLQLHAYQLTLKDGRKFTAPMPEDFKWEHSSPEDFEAVSWKI